MAQPYGMFAKAVLESGGYPNLLDSKGEPIRPYDVTAHSLALLMGVKAIPVSSPISFDRNEIVTRIGSTNTNCLSERSYGLYKSSIPSMDEGWTRWILTNRDIAGDMACWEAQRYLKSKY